MRIGRCQAKHFALTGNSSLDAWSSTSMPGLRWNAHYEVPAPSSTESLDAEVPVHTLRLCPPASALHEQLCSRERLNARARGREPGHVPAHTENNKSRVLARTRRRAARHSIVRVLHMSMSVRMRAFADPDDVAWRLPCFLGHRAAPAVFECDASHWRKVRPGRRHRVRARPPEDSARCAGSCQLYSHDDVARRRLQKWTVTCAQMHDLAENATSHDTAFCALPATVRTDPPRIACVIACQPSELVMC